MSSTKKSIKLKFVLHPFFLIYIELSLISFFVIISYLTVQIHIRVVPGGPSSAAEWWPLLNISIINVSLTVATITPDHICVLFICFECFQVTFTLCSPPWGKQRFRLLFGSLSWPVWVRLWPENDGRRRILTIFRSENDIFLDPILRTEYQSVTPWVKLERLQRVVIMWERLKKRVFLYQLKFFF